MGFKTLLVVSLAAATLCLGSSGLAQAQDIRTERVRFAADATGTTIEGRITGYEIVDYKLGARAGQTMTAKMTTDGGANYFNLLAPGETEVAFFNGSLGENAYTGRLPESGDYTIRVYQMRSAARRQETANYTLNVEIASADYADGLSGGPDFWQVSTAGGGKADMHETPSDNSGVMDSLGDGTTLRNRGCRISEGRRWCSVESLGDPPTRGWVVGDLLRESGYVEPQPQTDVLVPGTEFHATGSVPCARAMGQPMGSCRFGVVREGDGSGYVTVFWPEGGSRVLFFEDGAPVAFDRSEAGGEAKMTVVKEADLFLIRIGDEQLEIPEAVIVGG